MWQYRCAPTTRETTSNVFICWLFPPSLPRTPPGHRPAPWRPVARGKNNNIVRTRGVMRHEINMYNSGSPGACWVMECQECFWAVLITGTLKHPHINKLFTTQVPPRSWEEHVWVRCVSERHGGCCYCHVISSQMWATARQYLISAGCLFTKTREWKLWTPCFWHFWYIFLFSQFSFKSAPPYTTAVTDPPKLIPHEKLAFSLLIT